MAKQRNFSKTSGRKLPIGKIAIVGSAVGLILVVAAAAFSMRSSEQAVDHPAIFQKAQSLKEQDNHEEVVKQLSDHVDSFYDDPIALKVFADSQLKVPEPGNAHVTKAMRIYRRVVELTPNDADSVSQLFALYVRTGNTDLAFKFGKQAVLLSPDNLGLQIKVADAMINNDNVTEAIAVLDQIITAEPTNLDAHERRINAMVLAKMAEPDILTFIEETTRDRANGVSSRDLRLMYADVIDDKAGIARLLEEKTTSTPKTPKEVAWSVRILESNGQQSQAITLLEAATNNSDDENSRRALVYRYWQRGEFSKVLEMLRVSSDKQSDEFLILQSLSSYFLDQKENARATANQLGEHETQLARSWKLVLDSLLSNKIEGRNLLTASDHALQLYPQSAYLLHCQATAYETLGEVDLAIETYRKSIQYAPRWVIPRIAVSRLLLQQQQNELAFAEASSALRVQPGLPAAFEVVVAASVNVIASGSQMAPSTLPPIRETLANVINTTQDEQLKRLLSAIDARLDGQPQEADEQIQNYLQQANQLDPGRLEMLQALATDDTLRSEIAARATTQQSVPLDGYIQRAIEIADQRNQRAAVDYLEGIEFKNLPDPDLARRVLIARFLSETSSPDAADYWLQIAEDFNENARILQLVLTQPSLAADREGQRNVIDWLKECSVGNGVTWKLADASWLMAGETTEKTAAIAVLSLTDILRQAPTSAQAYRLLVEAYDRLDQPQKAMSVLQSALERGVDTPEFRLQIADRLARIDQASLAISHATRAGTSANATPEIRQRAASILLMAKAYRQAAVIMERDIPTATADNDLDFEFVAAYAMAVAHCGEANSAKGFLRPTAMTSDRWFDLWVDVATADKTPTSEAVAWLKDAEQWLDQNELHRRRRLSYAWSQLSFRENHNEYLQTAIRVLTPAAMLEDSPSIWLRLAMMQTRAGEIGNAVALYEKLAADHSDETIRAAALNNLAVHLASRDPGNLDRCNSLAREAVEMEGRPEYVTTLASILIDQDRPTEAIELLKQHSQRQPDSLLLRIRWAELLVQVDQVDRAEEVASQIEEAQVRQTSLSMWRRLNAVRSSVGKKNSELNSG